MQSILNVEIRNDIEVFLTVKCKRRTITRYEKGNINPKENRILEIVKYYTGVSIVNGQNEFNKCSN